MLTGANLLDKVKELGDISKSELVRKCGYVSTKRDGTERLHYTEFYKALLDAKEDLAYAAEPSCAARWNQKRHLLTLSASLLGFILGGPISGIFSGIVAFNALPKATSRPNASRDKLFAAFILWFAVGAVAMPISLWVAQQVGYNFDAFAFVQSQGRYKSYLDWSNAKENERKVEQMLQEQKARDERTRQQEKEKRQRIEKENRENQRLTRQRKWEIEQIEKREKLAAEKAFEESQELEKQKRIDAELERMRDPEVQREYELRHYNHLRSVGCIDSNNQVIRSLYCLNTEAPPN